MKFSILKKIYLFFLYKKILNKFKNELKLQFNLRFDNIFRFYTVLNIPQEFFEEPYNIRKVDIEVLSQSFIREYIDSLSNYLNQKGLTELYKIYDIDKVDKYSYLIVFGYSLTNTKTFANNLLYFWTPLMLLTIIILTIYNLIF